MRRKPWLAALLSILKPGLGQIYNGELRKGLAFLPLFLIGLPVISAIALRVPARAFVATIYSMALLIVAIIAFAAGDAWRGAARHGEAFQLGKCNRWYVYAALFILGSLLDSSVRDLVRSQWLEPFVTSTGSMEPTLLVGDRFYVDKRFRPSAGSTELVRGQIVVYHAENGSTYVKRVMGLSGDKIEIADKDIRINGEALPKRSTSDPSVFEETTATGTHRVLYKDGKKQDPLSTVVPPGQLFVLGDNRYNSYDSSIPGHGTIPIESVIGRPLQVWLSTDSDAHSFRWGRIGKSVE